MRTAAILTLLLAAAAPLLAGEKLVDDHFTSPTLPGRDLSPNRGKWVLADGVAACKQDDELFKKNKDHGPVIWYKTKFTDATIRFTFKPEACKTFVFTLNNDAGHLFRFVSTPAGLSVRLWPTQGHEASAIGLTKPSDKTPKLTSGAWTNVEVKFEGPRATLTLGDWKQTFDNPAIARDKTTMGLGFSYGALAVKDVSIEAP